MHSFKKEIIHRFQLLPAIEGLEQNKLIVYTAAGAFVGTPLLEETNDNNIIEALYSLISNAAKGYKNENNIPDDQMLDGNDGCFLMSDVALIKGQSRTSIPVVAIFYDQVIGISIGNID